MECAYWHIDLNDPIKIVSFKTHKWGVDEFFCKSRNAEQLIVQTMNWLWLSIVSIEKLITDSKQ